MQPRALARPEGSARCGSQVTSERHRTLGAWVVAKDVLGVASTHRRPKGESLTAIASGRAQAAAGPASLNGVVLVPTIVFAGRGRTEGDGAQSDVRDIEAHNALSVRCSATSGDGLRRLEHVQDEIASLYSVSRRRVAM